MPQPLTGTPPSAAPAPPTYSSIMQNLLDSLNPPQQNMGQMFGNSPIVQGFGNMMKQANQANALRGKSILQLLQGQGGTAKALNAEAADQQKAGIDQSMMDKGLANTTVGDSLKSGVARDLQLENNAVDEHANLNTAQMANSFTQQAPDMGMLANLLRSGGGDRPRITYNANNDPNSAQWFQTHSSAPSMIF